MTPQPDPHPKRKFTGQGVTRRLLAIASALVLIALAETWDGTLRIWDSKTGQEVRRVYVCDTMSPDATTVATRAITIQAPPAQVWQWIVQVGEDRAGFYSYTWLENLFRADMHNADRIHPAWQTRQVGDTVWLARKDRYHGSARQMVAAYEPGHIMVLVSPQDYDKLAKEGPPIDGSWTFIVEPEGQNASRLIMRSRGRSHSLIKRAFDYLIFDPVHFVMERGMLIGIHSRTIAAYPESSAP